MKKIKKNSKRIKIKKKILKQGIYCCRKPSKGDKKYKVLKMIKLAKSRKNKKKNR